MISIRARTEGITLSHVDESIFEQRYCIRCSDFAFCCGSCCNFGCDVDKTEAEKILSYRSELEKRLGISANNWFYETKDDVNYPSGQFVRARVCQYKCVFYDHKIGGCLLHRFALEKGLDAHELKPMVCCLFPLTWNGGVLFVSRFLDEQPCKGQGLSIFEAQKNELKTYFGGEFVSELEKIASERLK